MRHPLDNLVMYDEGEEPGQDRWALYGTEDMLSLLQCQARAARELRAALDARDPVWRQATMITGPATGRIDAGAQRVSIAWAAFIAATDQPADAGEALYATTGVPIAHRREVADARYNVILEMVAMAEAAQAEKGADDE